MSKGGRRGGAFTPVPVDKGGQGGGVFSHRCSAASIAEMLAHRSSWSASHASEQLPRQSGNSSSSCVDVFSCASDETHREAHEPPQPQKSSHSGRPSSSVAFQKQPNAWLGSGLLGSGLGLGLGVGVGFGFGLAERLRRRVRLE